MIKWLKNFFCKIVGIKQCECPEDEHIELYTKIPEPEVPVHEPEKWKCGTHSRFKKSCSICRELAGVS
jgi:hypothetical protein